MNYLIKYVYTNLKIYRNRTNVLVYINTINLNEIRTKAMSTNDVSHKSHTFVLKDERKIT